MDAVAVVASEKSRIDRLQSTRAARAVRVIFRLLGSAAPSLVARLAERLWFTPPRYPTSPRSRAVLGAARAFSVLCNGRRVAAWRWGEGPAVYLVHGWGGNAGDLTGFVSPLLQRGFSVVAFDAPAHGRSDNGPSGWRQGNFLEFAAALRAVVDATAPVFGVVAHSGGVTSTAIALREGLRVERVAFLASMADPEEYTRLFGAALGLSDRIVEVMKERAARRLGFRWDELSVPDTARRIAVPPLLLVHDDGDPETPWSGAADIAGAWSGSRLITTTGLGHRRLLKDPAVLNQVADFFLLGCAAPERPHGWQSARGVIWERR